VQIHPSHLAKIVAHAERDAPDECCGVLALRDGVVEDVVALENLAASPLRFEVDGPELLRALDRIEDTGATLGAIYHSHTRSAPYPSQTDINFASGWPGAEWLIVGLKGGEVQVKSYLIDDGTVTEVPVQVTGSE
jgi:proteasome lid subunit RPN8/RPN11